MLAGNVIRPFGNNDSGAKLRQKRPADTCANAVTEFRNHHVAEHRFVIRITSHSWTHDDRPMLTIIA
jgi:hypothetical protein